MASTERSYKEAFREIELHKAPEIHPEPDEPSPVYRGVLTVAKCSGGMSNGEHLVPSNSSAGLVLHLEIVGINRFKTSFLNVKSVDICSGKYPGLAEENISMHLNLHDEMNADPVIAQKAVLQIEKRNLSKDSTEVAEESYLCSTISARIVLGPDPEPMQEDQTGSNSGKLHVSLAGPNPEHMDDEFLVTAYLKVLCLP
ncbi:hypothetical protein Tco_0205852 [Tanacetum coccineum]